MITKKLIKKDREEIVRLLSLKSADMGDKDSAFRMILKYVNEGMSYCMSCPDSVRSMFDRLRYWYTEKCAEDNK
jgi:hypothetical protein